MSKSPTFVIHKAEEKEISNGDELEIHDGDQISLLEDEYVYKVVFCVKKVSPRYDYCSLMSFVSSFSSFAVSPVTPS